MPPKSTTARKTKAKAVAKRKPAAKRQAKPKKATRAAPKLQPFTTEHFRRYAGLMVFDDDERREPEAWQLEVADDIFKGFREVWQVVPEGNGKSTLIAQLALYGADYSANPWIPVAASAAKQARIIYDQAAGFVDRTDGLRARFKCLPGLLVIRSKRNGGRGIEVYAAEVKTGDGVIPFPFALIDELHRQNDMRLYDLWKGKCRKRGAQILAISTAGEPETPFESARDEIRRRATKRTRNGAHLRAEGPGLVLHEWAVSSEADCLDMAKVAEANPLSFITAQTLAEDFASPTLMLPEWKRLKCNWPTRSVQTAITDSEWDKQHTPDYNEIPGGSLVTVGFDVAWKWDTTAITPVWMRDEKYRLIGAPWILVPPRDGSSMHPDKIKDAFLELQSLYEIEVVIMDTSKAEDIAAWLEDDQGLKVVERGQSNQFAVQDYEAFMDGLRNDTLFHTGDVELRVQVLNAIARRLPGGDYRFDRPHQARSAAIEQDRRVIDALTASAMAVEYTTREEEQLVSVYEDHDLLMA